MPRELGGKCRGLPGGEQALATAELVVAIALRSRRDVQVHTEDVVAGSRAVVDQQVVAGWTQGLDESARPAVGDGRDLGSDVSVELMSLRPLHLGNHARGLIAIEDDESSTSVLASSPAAMRHNTQLITGMVSRAAWNTWPRASGHSTRRWPRSIQQR